MYDDYDEMMPDDGDYGLTMGEALCDTLVFVGKFLGVLVLIALVIGTVVYSVWKEIAIFNFLTGN